MRRLEGKVAVVTGAASGIGLATAELFAREGATVVMVDLHFPEGQQTAKEKSERLESFTADTTQRKDLAALCDHLAQTYEQVDILYANAGIAMFAPLAEVTEEDFDHVTAVNIKGTFFTVQSLLPVLRDGSSVILTSSVSGYKGGDAFSVYSATKAAIRSYARTFTADLKDRRIRVNALAPGNIETDLG